MQSQVRFNRICGHLTHGNPADVFPALGFAARFRKICKNKTLQLLGIPPKFIFKGYFCSDDIILAVHDEEYKNGIILIIYQLFLTNIDFWFFLVLYRMRTLLGSKISSEKMDDNSVTSSCQYLCLPRLRHLGGNPKAGNGRPKLRKTPQLKWQKTSTKVLGEFSSEFSSHSSHIG